MLREETGPNVTTAVPELLTQHASLHPRFAWILCYNETGSVQEVCRKFGISKKTFYKWLKRYQDASGDCSSLTDRSRRPHHSPKATSRECIETLRRAKMETGFGQRRLQMYLQERYHIIISERTIWKILKRLDSSPHAGHCEIAPKNDGAGKLVETLKF